MRVTTGTMADEGALDARGERAPAAGCAGDAQLRALESLFDEVHRTRMRELPFLNAALRVEALGFRDWHAARVGALVTPWSLMIVALPRPDAAAAIAAAPGLQRVERLATGRAQVWTFPSGEYEFHGHEADGLGPYQQCSLFSPALEFATHEDARAAARAALQALFAAPQPPAPRRYSRRGFLLGA